MSNEYTLEQHGAHQQTSKPITTKTMSTIRMTEYNDTVKNDKYNEYGEQQSNVMGLLGLAVLMGLIGLLMGQESDGDKYVGTEATATTSMFVSIDAEDT
jgi:hypothetical protein